ncbi:hypothetical protein NDU88_005251, partial [Pleurodeles waltl]
MLRLRRQVLPPRIAGECSVYRLVQQISVRLSTNSIDPSSPPQTLDDVSHNDPHCTRLAETVVVPGSPSLITPSTSQATLQTGPPDEVWRTNETPQSLLLEFGSMASELVQYGHL